MGARYDSLRDEDMRFIPEQKMFFVATAMAEGRINLSPKGLDCLRLLNDKQLIWLNLTGSGNETAVHLQRDGRITLMFCAFEGPPQILRLYGQARAIHSHDAEWDELIGQFDDTAGARQLVLCNIELVQRSCGFGVPLMDFVAERTLLPDWIDKKGEDGIREYWEDRNSTSLDGLPTGILNND